MNQLILSFFGAFQASLDCKPLTHFRSARVQGLLIYLALTARQAHERDVLAALFWPDESEIVAKRNLRQSLYRLRRLLGDMDAEKQSLQQAQGKPFLLITRASVQFNPAGNYSLDVADFSAALAEGQLETAVALYQGDLLPGFYCDSLPFDNWLRQEREQHHRQALNALNQLTTHSLTRADFQTAEQFAHHQLRLEPWREEAHRQLMQALALQGERSAALAQFETCRAALAEELGVEPTADTLHLAHRIREAQLVQAGQRESGRTPKRRLTIPFIGRQPEFETLVNAYRQAASDGLQVATLTGKAGIGKTRLARQFLEWAATQGADVLQSRAFETSARLSYQPLTHLLRQRLERENAPEDLLSDLWLAQLTRLLPELRDRYPDLPQPTQEENTARQHLFEAITRLVHALAARRPLLLVVDDWHWADTATLDVLHYAAVRWAEERSPILVVLTLRQEVVSESLELQSWLTRLHHGVETVPLQLSELSQSETEQLVQRLLAPDTDPKLDHEAAKLTRFSDWLFAETDGQPLFLTETLKSLVSDGFVRPDTSSEAWQIDWAALEEEMQSARGRILPEAQQIIRGWLDRITGPARQMLTTASVLAEVITFDHLCQVAALEQFEALSALDELLGKQLLFEEEKQSPTFGREPIFSFSHQKVRDLVYAEAGAARQRILHRRAFEVLQRQGAAAADCAHHALNAGLPAETIHHSLIAGNEAMALFAFRVAIPHYEIVWQLTEQNGWPEGLSGSDRQTLYTALGRAYELVGAWPKAQQTYEAMIADARTIGAEAMECLGLIRLATVYVSHQLDTKRATALLKQAQTLAEQNGDRRGLAEAEWALSVVARAEEGPKGALDHLERAMKLARELEHPQLLGRIANLLAYVNVTLRRWEAAEAYGEESCQRYTASGNLVLAADSQRVVGHCQMQAGRPLASLATLQETLRFSQQIVNLWGEADCSWKLALTQLELGDYGEAIRLARQAVEQTRRVGHPPLVLWASLAWGTVQRTMMQLNAARETFLTVLGEIPDKVGFSIFSEWALAELCALHRLAGDWERACAYAKQIPELPIDKSLLPFTFTGWHETEALLRGGEGDLARAEVARLGQVVGENRRHQLPLLRSRAVLTQWDGDLTQPIIHLEEALALAQEIGLPGEEWSISGALSELYLQQGNKEMAQEAYQKAAVIINRLAKTIDEDDLRAGFLAADPVRSVLKIGAKI